MSEASPFFESARLLEIRPIPQEDLRKFLRDQFARGGRRVTPEAANLLLTVGGQSPNDVQHLAHETWNVGDVGVIGAVEIHAALAKILADLAPMGEAWLERLTKRQTRALLAVALFDHLPATSGEFLRFAAIRNPGGLSGALRPCMKGHDPIVEKVGKAYRVRSRYLRVWLCVQRHAVQELIPMLRENAAYQRALDKVCPGLYLESNVAAE